MSQKLWMSYETSSRIDKDTADLVDGYEFSLKKTSYKQNILINIDSLALH